MIGYWIYDSQHNTSVQNDTVHTPSSLITSMRTEYRSNGNPPQWQPKTPIEMNRILLLLCCTLATWVGWKFLYDYSFALPYFETDFVDYCMGVSQWNDWTNHFPPKRSRLAGWIPGWLASHYGVLKGLSIASIIGVIGTGVVLTQWMERVSPLAGWCTMAWLLACSPWIGMGRFLTFYPEIVLWLTVGTAGVWFGLSKDIKLPPMVKGLLVGTSLGLCALTDARGLIWAGWFTVLTLSTLGWRCWIHKSWKTSSLFSLGFIGTLYTSWYLGRFAYGPYSTSLIRQLDIRPLQQALGIDGLSDNPLPTEFRWGWEWRSGLENIQFILAQQTQGLPSGDPSGYWWTCVVLIGLSGIAICRKHPLLIAVLIPFFVSFLEIGHAVEEHVRFYIQSLPILSGLLGVATVRLLPTSKKYTVFILCGLTLLLPYISLIFGPSWTIEREISHKMLSQAHPNVISLQQQKIVYGTPIHIQTLPVTQRERQITMNWDTVCTESLETHPPLLWFETTRSTP